MTVFSRRGGLAAALIGGAAVAVAALSAVFAPHDVPSPRQEASPRTHSVAPLPGAGTDAQTYVNASEVALQLPLIDPSRHLPPYRRDDFGTPWTDVDGNGCRQRDDLLARDLVDIVVADDGCTVLSGVLHDPYTGATITFQHDRVAEPGNPGSQGVQGDHIVSLAAAYEGGAWSWTDQQRLVFANTLENVLAVEGTANQSKQDSGPAQWLPQPAYLCSYVLQYTQIVVTWSLAVDPADRDVLVRTLADCADAPPTP